MENLFSKSQNSIRKNQLKIEQENLSLVDPKHNLKMIEEARDLFNQIDFQRDELIDMKELKDYILRQFHFEPNKETLLSIIASMDKSCS